MAASPLDLESLPVLTFTIQRGEMTPAQCARAYELMFPVPLVWGPTTMNKADWEKLR